MRENMGLYRGKQDNGEWVEGFLVDAQHIGNWVECEPVDPETVGQFTGKTDKNGKKIFEGDIIKAKVIQNISTGSRKYTETYVVAYHPGYCYFYLKRDRNNLLFDGNWIYGVFIEEVVGNIHDNPELLNPPEQNDLKVWEVWMEGKPNETARFLGKYHARNFEIACDQACLEHFHKRCYLSGGRPCYAGFHLFDKNPELMEVK